MRPDAAYGPCMVDHRPRAGHTARLAPITVCLWVMTSGCTDGRLSGGGGPAPAPTSLSTPRADTSAVPASVTSTRVEGYPIGLAAARDGGVWAVATRAGAVRHLRVRDGAVSVDRSARAVEVPLRAVDTSDGLWVTAFGEGTLRRLGPRPQVVDSFDEPEGVAVTGDSLWVVDQARSQVVELRTSGASATTVRRVDVGLGPRLVHARPAGTWVTSYSAGSVTRADGRRPVTRRVCDGPQGLALSAGRLWVACSAQDRLVGLDPGTLRREVVLDGVVDVDAVAATPGAVLALLPEGPTLVVVDPGDGSERGRVRLGNAPPVVDGNVDLLVHRGRVWASSPTTDEVLSVGLRELP